METKTGSRVPPPDEDPEPEENTEEWYAWNRRAYERARQAHRDPPPCGAPAKAKSHKRTVTDRNRALVANPDVATTGRQKDVDCEREFLYCDSPCGRQTQAPKKCRCQRCNKFVIGGNVLHEACGRLLNRCPRCGKGHKQ